MKKAQKAKLIHWYDENKRDLPWRKTKDPYKIWISETMLQQTTSTAVIPFYQKFTTKFKTVEDLARAKEDEVLSHWAGLGYYSRARNLHLAAQQIVIKNNFPQHFEELKTLKGVGDYTSRAVASLAFGQQVGVVDGNVIRFLSRYYDSEEKSWTSPGKQFFQQKADEMVKEHSSSQMNQAMMEIGATICLPKNPRCLLCPLAKTCSSLKNNTLNLRPIKKPSAKKEYWLWTFDIYQRIHKGQKQIALTKENPSPFLKDQWILPSKASKQTHPSKKYDFKHFITKYEIQVKTVKKRSQPPKKIKWVNQSEIKKFCPSSIVIKSLSQLCLAIFTLGLLGCQGGLSKKEELRSIYLEDYKSKNQLAINKLTQSGNHFFPQLIDEEHLVYVKEDSHKLNYQQAYIFDLKQKTQKKITFQSGLLASPQVLDQTLYFLSTTDEEKEHSKFMAQLLHKAPSSPPLKLLEGDFHQLGNFEIYSSTLQGRNIRRLTQHQGFDGYLRVHQPSAKIFFSRLSPKGGSEVHVLPLKKRRVKSSQRLWRSNSLDLNINPSHQGTKLAFVRWSQDLKSSQLVIKELKTKKETSLNLDFNKVYNPLWTQKDEALVFSASGQDENIELYFYRFSNDCLQRLTYLKGQDLWPTISGSKIVFANNAHGFFDLYEANFAAEQLCPQTEKQELTPPSPNDTYSHPVKSL